LSASFATPLYPLLTLQTPRSSALLVDLYLVLRVFFLAGFLLMTENAISAATSQEPFLVGADVSALATFEAHGAVYQNKQKPADALAILKAEGFNCFRLRLFVAPDHQGVVTNDLDYTLKLAKRVKASGSALLLDIHYSDTWADPEKQFKPAAWRSLPFEELKGQVRSYTCDVLKRFVEDGVKPDYVQLGNEITNGMLWPEGRVEFSQSGDHAAWERLGALLRSAHDGLTDAFPLEPRPVTLLHIESPQQLDRALWFCREAVAANVPFDMIGMSYYPEWHGTLAQLAQTLTKLAQEFRKPIVVAETAYPWTTDEHWYGLSQMTWPLTPDGQRRFLLDVLAVVRALPEGLGRGVIYWHPESVRVADMPVWLGGSCALFDRKGRVLPAASFALDASP
jgi:arabinogalactan endo-1,4-beta-galactosidase